MSREGTIIKLINRLADESDFEHTIIGVRFPDGLQWNFKHWGSAEIIDGDEKVVLTETEQANLQNVAIR